MTTMPKQKACHENNITCQTMDNKHKFAYMSNVPLQNTQILLLYCYKIHKAMYLRTGQAEHLQQS